MKKENIEQRYADEDKYASLDSGFGLYVYQPDEKKNVDTKFGNLTEEDLEFYHTALPFILLSTGVSFVSEDTIPTIAWRHERFPVLRQGTYSIASLQDYLKKFIGFRANVSMEPNGEWFKRHSKWNDEIMTKKDVTKIEKNFKDYWKNATAADLLEEQIPGSAKEFKLHADNIPCDELPKSLFLFTDKKGCWLDYEHVEFGEDGLEEKLKGLNEEMVGEYKPAMAVRYTPNRIPTSAKEFLLSASDVPMYNVDFSVGDVVRIARIDMPEFRKFRAKYVGKVGKIRKLAIDEESGDIGYHIDFPGMDTIMVNAWWAQEWLEPSDDIPSYAPEFVLHADDEIPPHVGATVKIGSKTGPGFPQMYKELKDKELLITDTKIDNSYAPPVILWLLEDPNGNYMQWWNSDNFTVISFEVVPTYAPEFVLHGNDNIKADLPQMILDKIYIGPINPDIKVEVQAKRGLFYFEVWDDDAEFTGPRTIGVGRLKDMHEIDIIARWVWDTRGDYIAGPFPKDENDFESLTPFPGSAPEFKLHADTIDKSMSDKIRIFDYLDIPDNDWPTIVFDFTDFYTSFEKLGFSIVHVKGAYGYWPDVKPVCDIVITDSDMVEHRFCDIVSNGAPPPHDKLRDGYSDVSAAFIGDSINIIVRQGDSDKDVLSNMDDVLSKISHIFEKSSSISLDTIQYIGDGKWNLSYRMDTDQVWFYLINGVGDLQPKIPESATEFVLHSPGSKMLCADINDDVLKKIDTERGVMTKSAFMRYVLDDYFARSKIPGSAKEFVLHTLSSNDSVDEVPVYYLVVHHKHGIDVMLGWARKDVDKELFEYVAEQWESMMDTEMPSDEDDAVDEYFETANEWYDINFYNLPLIESIRKFVPQFKLMAPTEKKVHYREKGREWKGNYCRKDGEWTDDPSEVTCMLCDDWARLGQRERIMLERLTPYEREWYDKLYPKVKNHESLTEYEERLWQRIFSKKETGEYPKEDHYGTPRHPHLAKDSENDDADYAPYKDHDFAPDDDTSNANLWPKDELKGEHPWMFTEDLER